MNNIELYICNDCLKSIPGELIEVNDSEIAISEEDALDCIICEKTEGIIVKKIMGVEIDEERGENISEEIIGCLSCDPYLCNGDLWDFLPYYAGDLGETPIEKLLKRILYEYGERDLINLDNIFCKECGHSISEWSEPIKTRQFILIIKPPPEIPEYLNTINQNPLSEQIEFFRPDISKFLFHLCRGNTLEVGYDNETYSPQFETFNAAQILWMILNDKKLKANKGIGLWDKAVCFTEKPLNAIKDSLYGIEMTLRKGESLRWEPYGIMFEKEYLIGKGILPVLPFRTIPDKSKFPTEDWFRISLFNDRKNFLHEREWRSSKDLDFEIEESVILLPDFKVIDDFKNLLEKHHIGQPKGFFPLIDIFSCL